MVVAFPECFDDRAIYHAVCTLRITGMNAHLAEARTYLTTPAAAPLIAAHDRHAAAIADRWSVGSMGTRGGKRGWSVSVTHNSTHQSRHVVFPDYPKQETYSTEELNALPADEEILSA